MSLVEIMEQLGVKEHSFYVGEGLSKITEIPAGVLLTQHTHETSHESVLLIGRVIVRRDGVPTEMSAPAVIHMPARVVHSVQAITPSLWACNWPNGEEG